MRFLRFSAVLVAAFVVASCGDDPISPKDPTELTFAAALNVDLDLMTKTASGLYYQDLIVGDGAEATATSTVTVHYEGWLHNGTKFDSSRDRGEPSTFDLSQLIPGWREGVSGMRVGGNRKLVVPSVLAYGSSGTGGGAIPPYATLVFDVELLSIK